MELSKNFLPARNVKLSAAHGACAVSTSILIVPWLVSMVMTCVPERGSPLVGGVPTFLIVGGRLGFGDALGSTSGFHLHEVGLADADGLAAGVFFLSPVRASAVQTTPTMTTREPAPIAIAAGRRRARRFRSA